MQPSGRRLKMSGGSPGVRTMAAWCESTVIIGSGLAASQPTSDASEGVSYRTKLRKTEVGTGGTPSCTISTGGGMTSCANTVEAIATITSNERAKLIDVSGDSSVDI